MSIITAEFGNTIKLDNLAYMCMFVEVVAGVLKIVHFVLWVGRGER